MSFGAGLEISQQPALRNLQVLQLAGELIDDPLEREAIIRQELGGLTLSDLLGHDITIDASVAVGVSQARGRRKGLVYDSGLMFKGQAMGVDYWTDYSVPVDSLVIDILHPQKLIEEDEYDPELAIEIKQISAPVLEIVRVPILAIRACALGQPQLY